MSDINKAERERRNLLVKKFLHELTSIETAGIGQIVYTYSDGDNDLAKSYRKTRNFGETFTVLGVLISDDLLRIETKITDGKQVAYPKLNRQSLTNLNVKLNLILQLMQNPEYSEIFPKQFMMAAFSYSPNANSPYKVNTLPDIGYGKRDPFAYFRDACATFNETLSANNSIGYQYPIEANRLTCIGRRLDAFISLESTEFVSLETDLRVWLKLHKKDHPQAPDIIRKHDSSHFASYADKIYNYLRGQVIATYHDLDMSPPPMPNSINGFREVLTDLAARSPQAITIIMGNSLHHFSDSKNYLDASQSNNPTSIASTNDRVSSLVRAFNASYNSLQNSKSNPNEIAKSAITLTVDLYKLLEDIVVSEVRKLNPKKWHQIDDGGRRR